MSAANLEDVATTAKAPAATSPDETGKITSGRLLSLDALRGFDMFWIVGGGSVIRALRDMKPSAFTEFLAKQTGHVQWEGFRFYDLIFPMFVFISGVSLYLSLDKSIERMGKAKTFRKLARRAILLILLGIFYYGGVSKPWPGVRLIGVLQYFGVAAFFTGLAYLLVRRVRYIAVICATLLLGYWAVMESVPFPALDLRKASLAKLEASAGSTLPKVVIAQAEQRVRGHYAEGCNLSNYIDYRYLPGYKINGAYENQPLLGLMGAVATCMLGFLAGGWLRRANINDTRKVCGLIGAGTICVIIGFAWGLRMPVIKKLWNSTFVLVASGYSAILLGCFYLIVDVWKKQVWCRPFFWIGFNPLTIYLAYNIISFPNVAKRLVGGDIAAFMDNRLCHGAGNLLVTLVVVGLVLASVRFLYARKISLRL